MDVYIHFGNSNSKKKGDGILGTPKETRDGRFNECRTPNSDAGNYGGCFGHFLENGFKFDY